MNVRDVLVVMILGLTLSIGFGILFGTAARQARARIRNAAVEYAADNQRRARIRIGLGVVFVLVAVIIIAGGQLALGVVVGINGLLGVALGLGMRDRYGRSGR